MGSEPKHIIIVGAGIGGLSTAIQLATQGHRVTLLEQQEQVGGKLNQVRMNGFAFDTGPSLITMPFVLQDLFRQAQRRLEDYLDLVPLDLTCRYFYRDGVVLNAWRDQQRLAAEFARLNAHDGEAFWRFYHVAERLFQASADPFLYHSLHGPMDVLRSFLRYVRQNEAGNDPQTVLPEQDSTLGQRLQTMLTALSSRTLDQQIRNFFVDEHIRQLFDRYATYNGSSPYQVAAVYSIIPFVEMAWGAWYPRGGMYQLALALKRLAHELGITIETCCRVERILVEHGMARGVVFVDGSVRRCDLVVANSDVVTTHHKLLSPSVQSRRWVQRLAELEPSCSGFVLLLGMDKQYPQLAHHSIFFSDNYHAEFDDLFVRKQPIAQPTIYVCATTRTDSSQAPAGAENLFILVNAPYLTSASNWQRDGLAYREHILDLLASYQQIDLHDLRQHIICESMITPDDFWQRYGANAGSIYGLSSNQRMAPFTRPGNRAREIRNLYFVGGSTHPGGGVPLVILSGKIVAELIAEDLA
jgi:phytoene desaturase